MPSAENTLLEAALTQEKEVQHAPQGRPQTRAWFLDKGSRHGILAAWRSFE